VLTSTFLGPSDEAALAARFKEMPDASHVQIVNVAYFIDVDGEPPAPSPRSKVMGLFGRCAPAIRPQCDVETLRRQIEDYLCRPQRSVLNEVRWLRTQPANRNGRRRGCRSPRGPSP
jgi:hypothetical protein